MFITSIVPYNDHLSLISIHKIAFYLILVSIGSCKAELSNGATSFGPLQVKGYHDYSFDEMKLCDNVVIDLREEISFTGLLHSPDYQLLAKEKHALVTKCNWTILAPEDHLLQIKIVDFDALRGHAVCPEDKLELRSGNAGRPLWIDLESEEQIFKYQNETLSSCDSSLGRFVSVNSDSGRTEITYQSTNSNLNILIALSLRAELAQSQICETKLLTNQTHRSLIAKTMLCNCASWESDEPCAYLERHFAQRPDTQSLDHCDHLSKLNKLCRLSAPPNNQNKQPDLEKICHNVVETKPHGSIASPSFYGKKYHNMALNCTYRILIQPYQTIQLRFKYFHLSAGSSMQIYDGRASQPLLLANYTSDQNDFKANFYAKSLNSNTNHLLIQVNINEAPSPSEFTVFNFTYQVKGLCIENQKQCNSMYELGCYAPEQRCNGVWDCRNGDDERGCFGCAPDHFRCRNNIFCYKYEDRCDGDHQCVDKSDELDCDKWTCNSANGTFLCQNGRCIYEQWVCDGANDCEDNSDEASCPSGLGSRRVITTAVLGGTLCCLLLVMALGCACKLYSLHTAAYRGSFRFSHTPGHSASLMHSRRRRRHRQRTNTSNNLSSFIRRLRAEDAAESGELPSPQHSVAPPTYNQTMGLVDEYEQRQMAFIEHVRSILSQQQQQQASGAHVTAMTIVPTSSSSTSMCRVNGRRSHRHRHHRSSQESRHQRRLRQSVHNAQASLDMGRTAPAESQPMCSRLASIAEAAPASAETPAPKTHNPNSANLRDKIAKLIKDIVVHHGDAINYVQLGETRCSNGSQEADNQQPNTSQNSNSSEDDVPLIQP